ncbi:hypothetical protein CAOG_04056 [Capsaspora owczarzaki ATCC 30864]|uniref:Uncharacterized protein n=1 Tax=Capsaspora owczarzaki (strain ATCC 30864) TaxID=595528 RepID=A0A0D2UDU0_CAPO3|nr:hypothetical protein CAOG_04056 [Capsaspora owczarzaki ATCC 30864]KJE93241.1 hypothetical protein CAOG_004056 [Capsaspora owczarzaki ATCC 30864]|eukprot:XP_004347881.2 hypothetical protein CAOG_04056 [Capsaspora owczarzaki ATCC 30864]
MRTVTFLTAAVPLVLLALFQYATKDKLGGDHSFSAMQSSALAGRHALVIGGTNGIGRGLAEWLARQGASVTVAGRSAERGQEVVQAMQTSALSSARPSGSASAEASASYAFAPIDAQSIRDVEKFCEEYRRTHSRLDYLVLTPGIATMQGRTETSEGIDQKLAIHYYGRIAAIQGLLPLLEATATQSPDADVRVLSVLSGGAHLAYSDYEKDPELREGYSLKNAAFAAGFYNDIALDSLSREHPTVSFAHAGPGFVATAWGTELNPILRGLVRAVQVFGKSPATCASRIGLALTAPQFKGGFHVVDSNGHASKVVSQHAEAREFVWANTNEVIQRAASKPRE